MSDIEYLAFIGSQGTTLAYWVNRTIDLALILDSRKVKLMNARSNKSANVEGFSLVFKLDQRV